MRYAQVLPVLSRLVLAALAFFLLAIILIPIGGFLFLWWIDFDPPYDPNKEVLTGDIAKAYFIRNVAVRHDPGDPIKSLPDSAKDFWIYDGGGFGGSIRYGTFECGSREDCLKAVEILSGIAPDVLKPWVPSQYAVVMEGMDFYEKGSVGRSIPLKRNPWDVRGIKDGVVYEETSNKQRDGEGDERMVYYAIDFGKNRVYYHYESGGFSTKKWRP